MNHSLFYSRFYWCLLSMLVSLSACKQQETDEIQPETSFTRVYDNGLKGGTYDPLDVRQTADSGYLVLGALHDWDAYLLKTDKLGNFQWEMQLPEPYVNALPNLFKIGKTHYFFCMDKISLVTYLMKVEDNSQVAEEVKAFPEASYPLAASSTPEGGFLLQYYNREERSTGLAKIDAGFNIVWRNNYPVQQDVEGPIVAHLTRTGDRLPFFTGISTSGYYFNGFAKYTFSTVFVNPSDGKQTGLMNGFRDKGIISAALHLSNNQFALARYSFGDNHLHPTESLNPASVGFIGDLKENLFSEIKPNGHIVIKRMMVNGQDVVLYAAESKSKQIILYAYAAQTLHLLGKQYLGYGNPYEMSGFTATDDGGLAVLGRTYVVGRYPRICLFKLSKDELTRFIKPIVPKDE
ncbi:MAG: hypothetical protein V4714_20620 [Bacteroidota bacterium]